MRLKRMLHPLGGFLAGLINGLLGTGGGMIAVPLIKAGGKCQQHAHASSVALILLLSILSAWFYLEKGYVQLSDAAVYLPGGVIGAIAGAFLLRRIPNRILKRIFGVLMIWAGVRLLLR